MKIVKFNTYSILVSFIFVSIISSCQKYEEGPVISVRSKTERVANTWKAEKIIRNGSEDNDENLRITFSKAGSYTNNNGGPLNSSVTGTWAFSSNKEQIQTVVDIVGLKQVTDWQILKLEEKSLWIRDGNDEYHLIPA